MIRWGMAIALALAASLVPAQTNAPPATARRGPVPGFVDPSPVMAPVPLDPLAAVRPARLRADAKVMAPIERTEVMPHSNLGILKGDLVSVERLLGIAEDRPPWLVRRWRRLSERFVGPTNITMISTNRAGG
jgi:hypothetical protein